jgi:hypothetical protein
MKENSLPGITQVKWLKKMIMLLAIAIMISASAVVTLAAGIPVDTSQPGLPGVADTPLYGTVTIDGIEWYKIYQSHPQLGNLYALLIPKNIIKEPGKIFYSASTGAYSRPILYSSSVLRSTINKWYAGATNIPTIKKYAVQNSFHSSPAFLGKAGSTGINDSTGYSPFWATSATQSDIAFALSYGEATAFGASVNFPTPNVGDSYFLRTIWDNTYGGTGAWGAWMWVKGQGLTQCHNVISSYIRPAIWVYQGEKTPEPKILSLSTAPITALVANHAANLPVTLTGTGLAGQYAIFSLVNSAGVPVYSYGPVAISDNFHQVLNISVSALTIPYGNYTFKATLVGATGTASVPLTIAKDLDSYWTFAIKVSPYSGQLTLSAVFDLGGYDTVQVVDAVYVNNVLTTNYIANGNTIWFPSGPTSGTVNIRFAGLKYNTLYPGFIIMLEKTVTL